MKPFTITWDTTASTTTAVVNGATATQNVPLTFRTPSYISTTPSGGPVVAYKMPVGTVRNIVLAAASGSIAGVSFSVVGEDQRGNALTETIVGATAGTLFYSAIHSITPTTAVTATVNVGLGQIGTTILSPMDVYNKNNNFTLAYKISGTVSLTPYYTMNQVVSFLATQQIYIKTFVEDPSIYYALPVGNANFIDSPAASNVLPITTNSSYSFVGIPLTGILTSVAGTTGSFVQTIIQQGAAY